MEEGIITILLCFRWQLCGSGWSWSGALAGGPDQDGRAWAGTV